MNKTAPHIIEGIRSGRESTYNQLFQDYYRPLTVYALKYLLDLDTAKEIIQDFFVHLYEIRASVVITTSIESYLYQSVRNRCLNHIKQQQNKNRYLELLKKEEQSTEDIEANIHKAELEHKIFRIIETLPPQCRKIFQLSRVQGLKNGEIAKQLNISKRTVETQISNALKALRAKLP